MGVEVPEWAGRMFHVVTGDAWPAADEDEVRDLAQLWFTIAAEFQRFAPEVADAADCLVGSGVVAGNAQAALRNTVGIVTGEGGLTVEKLAAGFEEMGRFLHGVALQVQYMKIIVIEELIILAAEVVYLVAMIPWTFGASAAGVGVLQVLGREFARQVLRQVAFSIATSVVLQVGLDVVAQVAQMAEGWRGSGEWDGDLTRSAAITGVVGGVLGPVFVGLGYFPARWLGRVVGRDVGEVGANVVKGAGHEYVTDGVSGAVQDGRWRPDRFSATAGGLDEGITSVAGVGRRKRSLHGSLHGGGSLHVPGGVGGVGVPGGGSLHGLGGGPGGVGGVGVPGGAGVPGPVTLPGDGSPVAAPGEGKTAGVVTNVNAVIRGREPDLTLVWRPDVRTVGEGVAEPGAGNLPTPESTIQELEWTTAEQVWAAAGQAWITQEQEWATEQERIVAEQVWGPADRTWTSQEQVSAPVERARPGQEREWTAAEQERAARVGGPADRTWTSQEQVSAPVERARPGQEREWTAAEQERAARVGGPADRTWTSQEQVSAPVERARPGQEREWAAAEQEWAARVGGPADRTWTSQEQVSAPVERARPGQEQEWTAAEQEQAAQEQEWTAAEQEWAARVWGPADRTWTSQEQVSAPVERARPGQEQEWTAAEQERAAQEQEWTAAEQERAAQEQEWTAAEQEWAARVWGPAEQVGTSERPWDAVDAVDAVDVRRGGATVAESGGMGLPSGSVGPVGSVGAELVGVGVGDGDVEARGGDALPSWGGVVRGQFAGEGGPTALAVPGAEAEVAVLATEGALVSQEEGLEARLILSSFRLGRFGRDAATKNIKYCVGSGRTAGQGWRGGELEGVLPSWVALSALPTHSGKADPGPLAVARHRLGRIVVGALWRSVEAAPGGVALGSGRGAGLGDVAEVAWRVAVAVAEQVPSADDPGRFVPAGVPLTGGLALAFVDQTLAAVTDARALELVAVVEQERRRALRALSLIRNGMSTQRTVRDAWTSVVVAFVEGVNRTAGGEVWEVLREWLLVGSPAGGVSGGVSGVDAAAGAGVVPVAGPGGAGLPSGPVGLELVGVEVGKGEAWGGDALPSWGGVVRGPFAGDGGPTALAVPGAEVLAAGGALVSQEEGVEARRILSSLRLGELGRNTAGKNVTNYVGSGRPSMRGWRGGALEGVFPSWVALSALPTRSGTTGSGPVAVARHRLGRIVVGALWRSVEADEAAQGGVVVGAGGGDGVGSVAGTARRVAVAVARQVPSAADDLGRFVGAGIPLMAGLASAFVDQTLVAVTEAGAPEPIAVLVEQKGQDALRAMSSLRNPRNMQKAARGAWTRLMVVFVESVNRGAGGGVWEFLREWLLVGSEDGGVSGGGAAAGAGVVPVAGPAVGGPAVGGAAAEGVAIAARGGALVSQQEGAQAQLILHNFRLGELGRNATGTSIRRWVGAGRPAGQGWRGGALEGVLSSWVALSALPTHSGNADAGPVAVARQTLGRIVVGALWRSVEAAEAVQGGGARGFGLWGDVAGVAWRVAVAGVEQVPSASEPGKFVEAGVPLTAGLALAFVDQTLVAVTEAGAPEPVAVVVEQERQKALPAISSLRHSQQSQRTVREAWTRVVVAFVDGVNRGAGVGVWEVLRDWLLAGSAAGGEPGGSAAPGAEGLQASRGVRRRSSEPEADGVEMGGRSVRARPDR